MSCNKLLLHICCAPDATVPWQELANEGYNTAGFMYGGNIHPAEEYERRAEALKSFSAAVGMEVVVDLWEPAKWLDVTKALAGEPEGGGRCRVCFALQLETAARFASGNGYAYLSTTLTISPHKNPKTVNEIGAKTAEKYGLVWVEKIWRANNGFKRSVEMSKRLGLYRQNYCGCVYSERKARDA